MVTDQGLLIENTTDQQYVRPVVTIQQNKA